MGWLIDISPKQWPLFKTQQFQMKIQSNMSDHPHPTKKCNGHNHHMSTINQLQKVINQAQSSLQVARITI